MPPRTGHRSQRVSKSRGDRKDAEHLQEIAEWRGILERMSAVRIEEAATVGAQFFDDLLRRGRPLRDHLLANHLHYRFAIRPVHRLAVGTKLRSLVGIKQLHRVIRLEVLHYSLGDQQQRSN